MSRIQDRIAMIALCVLLLTGAGLSAYFAFAPDRHEVIDVNLLADGSDTINFSSLGLIPGGTREFVLKLNGITKRDYVITFDFTELQKEVPQTLKDHIYAKITIGDEVICDEPLTGLFADDRVLAFSDVLKLGDEYDLKLEYYMPSSVGNEAQSSDLDFQLTITASNAGDFYE